MMELAALITAIGMFGAFFLGVYLTKRTFEGDIQRLTQQNTDLMGSLFHRIGYTPQTVQQMATGHDKQSERTHPDVEDAVVSAAKSHGFTDFFQRRQEAFMEDARRRQKAQ